MISIYAIYNTVTHKTYIGQSCDLYKRINRHFSELRSGTHHNILMQEDYNKYGESSFQYNEIAQTESQIDADTIELHLINKYFNDGILYNLNKNTHGGDIISYHPNLENIKTKMSESMKKRYEDNPDLKIQYSNKFSGAGNPMYGKHHSMESREKMSITKAQNPKIYSNEDRIKMSESMKKRYEDNPIYREKSSESLKNRWKDPDQRKILRNAIINRWKDPIYKENMVTKIKEFNKARMKKVYGDGIIYESVSDAARKNNLTNGAIINRCRSDSYPNWYYLLDDKYN